MTEKYLNQKQDQYHELIRKELETLVRGLYRDSNEFLKEETVIDDPKEMLKNLIKAIEKFSIDYKWPL